MIFVTGDTHGFEFKKLNTKCFKEQKELTRDDYVIIAGDFGLIWNNSKEEQHWLKWLEEKSFTILFVDGNHENFDMLNNYKVEMWNGGKVHKIRNNIIHLMRGQVFIINDKKIFTFGGAKTVDKEHRIENKSWWKEEIPSEQEFNEALNNLQKYNYNIDYIITHTCDCETLELLNSFFSYELEKDTINFYLDKIENKTKFKKWYFGHFHIDVTIDNKHCVLYDRVRKIGE